VQHDEVDAELMMFGMVAGERITAEPGLRGSCPHCRAEVIAKCGPINVWHWAHRAADCDTWTEPMTQWHIDWQSRFPDELREVTIGNHIADAQLSGGVIEFQHSSLSADEIRERENHYGRMLWVFDAIDAYESDRLNLRRKCKPGIRSTWELSAGFGASALGFKPGVNYVRRDSSGRFQHVRDEDALDPGAYRTFRWQHPRRSILACRRPVFLDLGEGQLLELKKMHQNAPYGGWGYLGTIDQFLDRCGLVRGLVGAR
jgi:competence protein CoiA